MPYFDLQHQTKEIDDFGETITLRTITKSSYNKWGDPTEANSDETGIKAVFNIITQDDKYNPEGIFKEGDILFFFKGDQANVTRGNRIQYNSTWYEILEVTENKYSGTVWLQTAKVSKI